MPLPPRRYVKETVNYAEGKDVLVLEDDSVIFPEGENLLVAERELDERIQENLQAKQRASIRLQGLTMTDQRLRRAKQLIQDYKNVPKERGPQ